MKSITNYKLLLILVVLLGFILRFYRLGEVPVSLYWDEVASAYNAYSIAMTGKDEYGIPHPFLFKSFVDYKTPGNIYLTSLVIKVFGLNEFSTRFSSAFLGSLSILICFFLIKELLKNQRFKNKPINENMVAILASFLFAISPWHIQFSRTGFEANVALFIILLSIFLILKFINSQRPNFLYLSAILFGLSFYFYRSVFVFVPLFLVGLFFIYRQTFLSKKNIKHSVIASAIFFLVLLPFLPPALSPEGTLRQRQVNIFDNLNDKIYQAAVKQNQAGNTLLSKILYNRRIVYASAIISNYTGHFGPTFLFTVGDTNGRHDIIDMGLMYIWEAPFLVLGLLFLLKLRKETRYVILLWFLVAPIPGTFSLPSPHALRSLTMLPIPQLLAAFGLTYSFYLLRKEWRKYFILGVSIIVAVFFLRYLYLYYQVTPKATAHDWADGYKQLTQYVFANEGNYDKVIVSGHWWQPYIFFLFYKQYSPKAYQESGSKKGFDKYVFGGTRWDMDGQELDHEDLQKLAGAKNILVALSPVEYELQKDNVVKLTEIKDHNNKVVFIMAKPR